MGFWWLQADAQIYNKVLALMEDWADAINLPAYRQEYNNLKVRRRRMPWLVEGMHSQARHWLHHCCASCRVSGPGARSASRRPSTVTRCTGCDRR